ncbi:hypothetical protein GCM10010254_57300 [Streptomyces chromofuscus]|nr:hypothetical protein GCM10010254_57300 [Streptomyces chromofuscus]
MPLPARPPRGQHRYRRMLSALGICATVLTATPAMAQGTPDPADPSLPAAAEAKIDPSLLKRMNAVEARGEGRVEAAVVLRQTTAAPALGDTPAEVRDELSDAVESVQEPVVDLVEAQDDEVLNTFWLKNMVLVKATPDTLGRLAGLAAVDHIIPNFTVQAPPAETVDQSASAVAAATEQPTTWGLARVGADKVHSERNLTGDGVRVAVLDTGIDASHPDLAGKLTSDDANDPTHPGGWIEFDKDGKPVPHSEPYDTSYHGTHVAGTIAGGAASGTRIGVAPDVDLMGAVVIPNGSGSLAQVLAGMQWAVAPYAADGTPAGQPADVVSMSLGAEGYADEFIEPTRNILRAGAFPSFAIGNECVNGSASPGNVYDAVSVGATDEEDNVAEFSCGEVVEKSSWGAPPADWPDSWVVPNVSAPGVNVLSALPGGGYGLLDGTSMATPHVSGTVALMLQADPDLSPEEALSILTGTSFFDDRYGARPNSRHGHGRIDADAAVAEASLRSGVRGTVTDGKSGKPLAGVTVTRTDTGRAVTTDAQGHFSIRLAPGTRELKLSRFGYVTTTTRQQVVADRYIDVDPGLTRTRWGTISGTVTYAPTESTVPGTTVAVLDVPDELTAVTDRNGRYTIHDVPVGTYDVRATAPGISRSTPLTVTVGGRSAAVKHADLELPRPSATDRVSLTAQGGQLDGDAWWPDVNDDGQVVAFASLATNLVPGDTNGTLDIFVSDLEAGTVERVSVASDGTQGDDFSLSPSLSGDGRYVGFNSGAGNLVPGDTNGQTDAFVHDRSTGTTEVVSVAADGTRANGLSSAPSLSDDGRYATFISDADNLVSGDTNKSTDVFLHDRQTGETVLVSQTPAGVPASGNSREPSISSDGRYIAFQSSAGDLVPGDTDGAIDVFVRDRVTGTTTLVGPEGENTGPSISGDGQLVAFTQGWQLYVSDLKTGEIEQVSVTGSGETADDWAFAPSLSEDGTKVAFYSYAANLSAGDTNGLPDVFVRDRTAGTTTRISGGLEDTEGDGLSFLPSLSGDGRTVAFESTSANLVAQDSNGHSDIFVHDLAPGPEPLFALSDLTVSPSQARPGAPVRVTAHVKNVGVVKGTYEAELRVAGEPEQQRSVTVGEDQDALVSFTVRRDAVGTYRLRLGPLTGQFTVR